MQCSSVKSIDQLNFSADYDKEALTKVYHRLVKSTTDSPELQLRISLRKLPAFGNEASFQHKILIYYTQRPSYSSKKILAKDTLSNYQIIGSKDNDFYIIYKLKTVPYSKPTVLDLVIKDRQSGRLFHHDVRIPANLDAQFYQFQVAKNDGCPIIPLYINQTDTINVSLYNKAPSQLYLKRYGNPYPPALPPFITNGPTPKSNRFTQELKTRTDIPIVLLEPALYTLQTDTSFRECLGVVQGNGLFPSVSYTKELVAPLIYMTSSDERKKLASATEPKPQLDKFFLEIGGTKDNARRIIRSFYEHIEESNEYFTTFKDGWRTDKGLIFTIFGQPDKVYKTDDTEEWEYETNAIFDQVRFTFLLRPTIFHPEYYELIRHPEYERLFYSTVDSWRKGVLTR